MLFLNMYCGSNCWTLERNIVIVVKFTGVVSLTLKFVIIIIFLQHGGIESNPGPVYNIEKDALDTFHRGDTRFGATAGVQCACNSLLALRWSKIRDCRIWRKDDLDHVLNEGDQLYKSLSTIDLLLVEDLSRTLKLLNMDININFYT